MLPIALPWRWPWGMAACLRKKLPWPPVVIASVFSSASSERNRFSFSELLEVLLLVHKLLKLSFVGLKENKNRPCATDLSLYPGHMATATRLTKTCGKPVKSRQCQHRRGGQGLKSDTGSAEKALSFFQKTPFRHGLKWLYPGVGKS